MIDLARKSGTCTVKNIQNPPLPYLIATEKTKIENFLSEIQVLLPVLNINFFVPPIKIPPKLQTLSPQPLLLTLTTTTVSAEAEIIDNKFVVRQGAMASASEVTSLGASYVALRRQLKDDGKLVNSSEHDKYTFSQDVEFNSLTAAAAVICGSTMSGPATWKVKDTGQTYSAWLQEQVDAASAVPDGVVIATDTAVVQ